MLYLTRMLCGSLVWKIDVNIGLLELWVGPQRMVHTFANLGHLTSITRPVVLNFNINMLYSIRGQANRG
jgi:hypothetical protein